MKNDTHRFILGKMIGIIPLWDKFGMLNFIEIS